MYAFGCRLQDFGVRVCGVNSSESCLQRQGCGQHAGLQHIIARAVKASTVTHRQQHLMHRQQRLSAKADRQLLTVCDSKAHRARRNPPALSHQYHTAAALHDASKPRGKTAQPRRGAFTVCRFFYYCSCFGAVGACGRRDARVLRSSARFSVRPSSARRISSSTNSCAAFLISRLLV